MSNQQKKNEQLKQQILGQIQTQQEAYELENCLNHAKCAVALEELDMLPAAGELLQVRSQRVLDGLIV